ncbi:MAG: hypothetical protein KME13_08900 [Myxacorys californica WJT36-NPBG1]|jgi:hypothetical protein|nr:hypothetical protein [Myxacorys californica WJT36-NPBG1]
MRQLYNQNSLLNLTFLLCFFPFFRIIPIGNSETQPIAAIVAGIYLLNNQAPKFLRHYITLFFSVTAFYFLISVFRYFLVSSEETLVLGALQSILILTTPLLIFAALFDNLRLISAKTFRFCLYPWLLISILQQCFPSILSSTGISTVLTILIPRFLGESLGGSRGVSGFSPEPSYAAQIIIGMLAFIFFLRRNGKIRKLEYYFMISSCVIMVFLNLSATIAIFFAIFLTFHVLVSLMRSAWKLLTFQLLSQRIGTTLLKFLLIGIFTCLILVSPVILTTILPNSRILDLLTSFSSSSYEDFDVFKLLNLTNELGSQRSISVYAGYFNAFTTHGFGSGLGSWSIQFLNTLEDSGLNPSKINFFMHNGFVDLKPYAYGALVAFDMGVVGLVFMSSIFVAAAFRKLRVNAEISQYAWACLGLSLLMVYFNSVASLPTGWLLFLLFLQDGNSLTQYKPFGPTSLEYDSALQ